MYKHYNIVAVALAYVLQLAHQAQVYTNTCSAEHLSHIHTGTAARARNTSRLQVSKQCATGPHDSVSKLAQGAK